MHNTVGRAMRKCLFLVMSVIGLICVPGCVVMIDLHVTNNYPFKVSIGHRFVDINKASVLQDLGDVPGMGTKTLSKVVARGEHCHLEIRDAGGRIVATVDGPAKNPNDFDTDSAWNLTIGGASPTVQPQVGTK